jgi:hypothetical protein
LPFAKIAEGGDFRSSQFPIAGTFLSRHPYAKCQPFSLHSAILPGLENQIPGLENPGYPYRPLKNRWDGTFLSRHSSLPGLENPGYHTKHMDGKTL